MPSKIELSEEVVNGMLESLNTVCDRLSTQCDLYVCILFAIRLYETLLAYCSYKSKENRSNTCNHKYINELLGVGKYHFLLDCRNVLVHEFYKDDKDCLIRAFTNNYSLLNEALKFLNINTNCINHLEEFLNPVNTTDKFSTLKSFIN